VVLGEVSGSMAASPTSTRSPAAGEARQHSWTEVSSAAKTDKGHAPRPCPRRAWCAEALAHAGSDIAGSAAGEARSERRLGEVAP
jgi:hypothetical protein